jgi:hypothetical protein
MKRRKFLSNIVSGGLALSALPQVSAQQRDSAAKKTAEAPKKFPPRLKLIFDSLRPKIAATR